MPVAVSVSSVGSWTVLAVGGAVDLSGAPRLREEIVELIRADQRRLVIDCTELEFIDSTGLGVLVGALKRIRDVNGELRLASVGPPMARVLRITGLHDVFSVHPTVADATSDQHPLAG